MAYLPLSTANLPDPVIDPAQDESPSDYFGVDAYTGTGASHERSALQFQPDLVWIKGRSDAYSSRIFDSVRGVDKVLVSDTTAAEFDGGGTTYFTSFDSDGFTLTSNISVNGSSKTFVAWNWKANGSGVSNTDGSITSTVSANTTSGFSIVSYTGTGATSSGVTIGHGLGATPVFVITKKRSGGTDYGWSCWHKDLGGNYGIWLDKTSARNSNMWAGYTNIDADVFSPPDLLYGNETGADYINYLFADVEGFSKFGSYVGNDNSDGPFVYTGFRPAFVMAKCATNVNVNYSSWTMQDTSRSADNVSVGESLYANKSVAEGLRGNGSDSGATTPAIDFLSNGFKIRSGGAEINQSGSTHIYMAFAENPFKYSNAR